MLGISEGDVVVTPDGKSCKYAGFNEDGPVVYLDQTENGANLYDGEPCELVKLNDPLRVRVDSERQAEYLVGLAEEYGFDRDEANWLNYVETDVVYSLHPTEILFRTNTDHGYDLTFVDDLPQIETWIEFHGESEDDECDSGRCYMAGHEDVPGNQVPDNTDDDSCSEPLYPDGYCPSIGEVIGDVKSKYGDSEEDLCEAVYKLESELSDCREELDEVQEERDGLQIQLENYAESNKKFRELNGNLRKRIEEARDYVRKNIVTNKTIREELLQILTPDSDEGDGC